jgi:hypothetical protein
MIIMAIDTTITTMMMRVPTTLPRRKEKRDMEQITLTEES